MERLYYKAINFDLDIHLLDEFHPSGDYHRAYYDLKKFFRNHGFNHRQGSGYVSDIKLNSQDIYLLIDTLFNEYPWIADCVKEFDVTNIGTQYSLADDIRAYKEKDSFEI